MTVLALDTTTRAGSVAVVADGEVRWEGTGDPARTHGERLPEELMTALRSAGVGLDAVALFAVAAGPGSFTGLRVGIAAMQGLAVATSRKIVPVSTLEALALAADSMASSGLTATWMDAQRAQVFAALYRAGSRDPIVPPSAMTPAETLVAWSSHDLTNAVFIGDGAVRYADTIRATAPAARILEPPPLAAIVGRIAAAQPERAVNPHAVIPIYVRRPDAELARLARAKEG